MKGILSPAHQDRYDEFRQFVGVNVEPFADDWDRNGHMPSDVIRRLGQTGYLGAILPPEYGGAGWDFVTFGMLNEALGRGSSSLTVLLTVQSMVATTIARWGTPRQKERWLPSLASGDIIAAFCLTEPAAGSAINEIETEYSHHGKGFLLSGTKRYITFGEVADVYLVFGYVEGKSIACLVAKDTPGVKVIPIKDMLGFRSCHLAQLEFDNVEIAPEQVIGKAGFALSHIALLGLHYGRMSTAFSATGLIRACLETGIDRAAGRVIAGVPLDQVEAVRDLVAGMGIGYETSLLFCLRAARSEDERSPQAIENTITAKYIASRHAVDAAGHAVQIGGAYGCHEGSSPAGRYYRDSKIMEIIEGTSQVLQKVISNYYINHYKTFNCATAEA